MLDPPPPRQHPQSGATINLDARSLRGLAHPLRLRLLCVLRDGGPSTSTRLAERLGLSSGATSYHLRQLAAYGFVEEDRALGSGRERWWRARYHDVNYLAADFGPESVELSEVYLRAVATIQGEQVQRAIDEWAALPPAWQRAGTLSDLRLRLTHEELASLCAELFAVIGRYRRDEPAPAAPAPPGSAPVTVQVQAFRSPGADGERAR
jgi:DNA-binding transcriptional ArsR family regulator